MRYRALDAKGDYAVNVPFYDNVPAVVAQAAYTRLQLWQGEWFADTSDGTPYMQDILGATAALNPDVYIKQRILETPGVLSLASYSSSLNAATRALTVRATIDTVYGRTTLAATL